MSTGPAVFDSEPNTSPKTRSKSCHYVSQQEKKEAFSN